MIYTNALSVIFLHRHINGLGNKNLRSIRDFMRASKPAVEKYKRVCKDFPNISILTKSATPGEIQLTFGHAAVGNKSLGGYIVNFDLLGDISFSYIISLNIKTVFAADGNKICLLIAEVLLRSAPGDLARSKKQRHWTPRNAVLLLPFLAEAAILHGESYAGELPNVFSRSITKWAKEGKTASGADDDNNNDSVITIEAKDATLAKPGKAKQATANILTTIADNFDDVLAFLQAVYVKSPRVVAAPLSLRADKRTRVWFQSWAEVDLPTPPKPAPQDHTGLTVVLNGMGTRLHTAEALRPVVAAQSNA